MGRMAELHAEQQQQEDGNAALYFDLCGAIARVAAGTATVDDARLLAYGCSVSLSDVGIAQKPRVAINAIDFDSRTF